MTILKNAHLLGLELPNIGAWWRDHDAVLLAACISHPTLEAAAVALDMGVSTIKTAIYNQRRQYELITWDYFKANPEDITAARRVVKDRDWPHLLRFAYSIVDKLMHDNDDCGARVASETVYLLTLVTSERGGAASFVPQLCRAIDTWRTRSAEQAGLIARLTAELAILRQRLPPESCEISIPENAVERLRMRLDDPRLGLTTGTIRCVRTDGFLLLGDVVERVRTTSELLRLRNFGPKRLEEIQRVLTTCGLPSIPDEG